MKDKLLKVRGSLELIQDLTPNFRIESHVIASIALIDTILSSPEEAAYYKGYAQAQADGVQTCLSNKDVAIGIKMLHGKIDNQVMLLKNIIATTKHHETKNCLFARMHPRKTLDIKRRVDGKEDWFEGDWLSNLWKEIQVAEAAIEDIKN